MRLLIFLTVFVVSSSFAQSKFQAFKTLSTPEKCWVVFHPFKAKKAYRVTREVLRITDSIVGLQILDKDLNGGLADAFKHSYWMARLTQEIGKKPALRLGKAHEKGNYKAFKKGKPEDGALPDKPGSDMDLFNNKIGAEIGEKFANANPEILQNQIIKAIESGRMRILKKDQKGRFLSCNGQVIDPGLIKGKWENDKCLVKTSAN